MKEVKTEIIIDAPKEKVWKVLTDFDAYSSWNPVIKDVKATPEVNRTIRFGINLFGQQLPIAAKIQRFEENWYLGWGTDTSLPSNHIVGAHHFFELNEDAHGKTRLVHNEMFYGILPKIMWPLIKKLKGTYEEMNQALKTRVETLA